jgi:hypothetical protein
MRPDSWTELFFLDEATAFAAGHRPCGYCRRARFTEFKAAWLAANPGLTISTTPRIAELDNILHEERVQRNGKKVTHEEALHHVPDGVIVELDSGAYLLWNRQVLKWSFNGYTVDTTLPLSSRRVRVLTPASIVRTFRHGFQPDVHESAREI